MAWRTSFPPELVSGWLLIQAVLYFGRKIASTKQHDDSLVFAAMSILKERSQRDAG